MLGLTPAHWPPFIGREQERAAIFARLALARNGHGGVVLVAGEPGVGKTRLTMELAHHARDENWLVLIGRAYDSDGMPPYLPWSEALRTYIRACPSMDLRAQLGDGAAEVVLIAHEVRVRLPDLLSSPPLSPEHERYRLFESVSEFLHNIARSPTGDPGMLIVLDDLHWADRPTLLLLGHLARRLAGVPILVVGTYRTVELERTHPLSEVLADLSREHLYERVLLQPFSVDEVAVLITDLTGAPAAPAVVRAIYRETEGNPYFIEEVVRHLHADGRDLADPRSIPDRWAVPEGVRHVLGRRLARLTPVANELLQVAAVVGDGFRFDVLTVASGAASGPLIDALEESIGAGLLREQDGRYHFTHALIRQTIEEDLSSARRAQLHRQVGQALERLHGNNSGPYLAELAHHFCAGAQVDDVPKAIGYAWQAAERAIVLLAYEESARLHQLAIDTLELTGVSDEALRGELLLALGEARRKAGQLDEALEAFKFAAEFSRTSGDAKLLASSALGYEDTLILTGLPRAQTNDPSVQLLEEALRVLPPAEGVVRARVLAALGRAFYFAGASFRASELIDDAVSTARRVGDRGALAYALSAHCMAVWAHEDRAGRLAAATELLRLAEEGGDAELALEGRRWRLYALLDMGDIEAVDEEVEAYRRVAADLRQPQYLSHVALWKAMRALMGGRFSEAEAYAREMLETGRRAQRREAELTFAAQMLVLYRDRGDHTRLAELVPALRENADRDSAPKIRRAHLAHIQAVLGRRAEARAELERIATGDFTDIPRDMVWLHTLVELVEVCAYLGDARRAATLYELMRPYEQWNVNSNGVVCPGPVAYYLGLAARTIGRWDAALTHFNTAAALAMHMGAQPMLARAMEAQATALLAKGRGIEANRADDVLEQALVIYDDLQMAHDAARVRDLRGGRAPRPMYPDGLTEREIDVLRLIASGKSNNEIADELVLSVRTVERHITNLYGKIEARGRADATAYAFRHSLI
jgi:DNA-binding CsgD family transcriptional regulator